MRNLNTLEDVTFTAHSLEETEQFAALFAKNLQEKSIIALFGDLGSGKTTFLKSVISSLGQINPDTIESPTFNLLNIYTNQGLSFYHFDLYRLKESADFLQLGFQEFFDTAQSFVFLEWSEKILDLLPEHTIKVHLSYEGPCRRKIEVKYPL